MVDSHDSLPLQGDVYRLDFENGRPTRWVLKAARPNLMATVMPSMAREWAIGRQLVVALGVKDKQQVLYTAAYSTRCPEESTVQLSS